VSEVERVDAVDRYPRTLTPEAFAYLGLKTGDVLAPLVVLLCERYDLDPLLNHLEVIKTGSDRKLYITRDGYLDVAHRSGQLGGIVLEQVERGNTGWRATVSVHRKDMPFPFTYSAGCGDAENNRDPEAMAIARAERRALKRAFRVITAIERTAGEHLVDDEPVLIDAPPERVPPDWRPSSANQRDAHKAIGALDDDGQERFLAEWRIESFSEPWPAEAVADALGRKG
jgi:hypothetical protein